MNKTTFKDEFLSEEDLSLANMSDEELEAYWNFWLQLAQTTNQDDEDLYSHGVFTQLPFNMINKDEKRISSHQRLSQNKLH